MRKLYDGHAVELSIVSISCALFLVVGACARLTGSLDALGASPVAFALLVIVCAAVLSVAFALLFKVAEGGLFGYRDASTTIGRVADAHPYTLGMTAFLVCWLLPLVAFYPGICDWDPYCEILSFLGVMPFTTHDPPAHVYLLGAAYRIGEPALYAIVCAQVLLFAYACVRTAALLRELDMRRGLIMFFVASCIVFPYFPARELSLYKEALYLPLLMLFFVKYVEVGFLGKGERSSGRPWLALGLLVFFGIAVSLLRNEGAAIVCISLLVLVLVKGRRILALGSCAAVAAVSLAFSLAVWPALGLGPGSTGERFSLPLQQTARYLVEYPAEVSAAQRAAIDAVADADTMARVYDPSFADPVKALWHGADAAATNAYLATWAEMFAAHPGVYLEAAVLQTYGYMLPWIDNLNGHPADTYQIHMMSEYDDSVPNILSFQEATAPVRVLFDYYCSAWMKLPPFALFANPGLYTWLAFALFVFAWRPREGRAARLTSFCPAILLFAVCLASPVNACMRYFLPIVPMLPVLACIALGHRFSREREGDALRKDGKTTMEKS